MADIAKVKRNIQRMLDQGAPETDIDAYVASEGVTIQELQAHKNEVPAPVSNAAEKGDMPMSWGDTAMDVAKSAGVGLGRGIISIPGLPSDLSDLTQNIVQWGGNKTGLYDGQAAGETFAKYNPLGYLPNSNEIQGYVEDNVTGKFYEPKSVAGEYARTIGEFAPAMAAGPASIGRKAAITFGGSIASETGGQLARQYAPEYEGYARVGLGLLGGTAAAKGATKREVKGLLDEAPTPKQIKQQTNAAYDQLRQAGVKYDANDYAGFANYIEGKVRYNPKLTPGVEGVFDEIRKHVGKSPDFEDIEDIRKMANDLVMASDAPTRRIGTILKKELDAYAESTPLATNGNIPADKVASLAKEARELGRRNILLDRVKEMDRRSEFYVSGPESGMRNQVASYAKSKSGKYLTDAEKEAFKKVVNREGLLNLANQAGGRLGGMLSASAAGGAGFMAGGPITGLLAAGGAGLANLATRAATGKYTDRAVDEATKVIALGKEGQKKLKQAKGVKPTETGLLGAASAQQGQAPPIRSKSGTFYVNPSWKTYNYIKEFGEDPPWSAKKSRALGAGQ